MNYAVTVALHYCKPLTHYMQSQVIICDQQSVYALGCGTLINEHPQFNGYCIIRNLQMLNEIMSEDHPNYDFPKVLVLDSGMLNFTNPLTYKTIQQLKKSVPVMVLFNDEDDLHLYNLIDIGFSVIVSRHVSEKDWVKALLMAQQDKVYFCATIADKVFALMNQMDKIKQIEIMQQLNIYDKYILVRICQEASSKQIAYEVGHSKRTIEGHRTKLMQQFEVKNLAGLVKIAFLTKLYDHYLMNPGLYDVTLCAKTSAL
jgi:DNA-binding NarL/FixJ family response regulator